MMNPLTTAIALWSLLALATAGCGRAPGPAPASPSPAPTRADAPVGVVDHTVESLTGETVDLGALRGRVLLIVNTASQCGYTPQYAGLQRLHELYGDRGLVVIGFPSNDFGNQEPGTAEEIARFCSSSYAVTFPMMAKVHTTGPKQAALYRTLTSEVDTELQGEIRWNFTKFLVDQGGRVVARFEPAVEPLDPQVTAAVERLLGQQPANG